MGYPEKMNPTAADLATIGARYRGKASRGDEWCMTFGKGDATATFYSSIGTAVYAMCKRLQDNPGACVKIRDAGDGVFFHLRASEVRSPAILVQKTPPADRAARVAARFDKG